MRKFQDHSNGQGDSRDQEEHGPLHELPKNQPFSWNYWESTEVKNLFLPSDMDESVKDALDQ